LATIFAVAASVGLLAAEDHPPANNDSAAVASAPASTNGTLNSGNTQSPVETDIGQLQRFLSMPPERLEQMRKAIVYLENMPPGELAALRLRMHSIEELGQEIRAESRSLPKAEDRSILGRYLMTLYPEDIQPLLKNLRESKDKPEARQQIVQDMLKKAVLKGIKPDPNAIDRGAQPNGPRGGNRGRGPNSAPGRGETIPTPVPAATAPASTN
jgi:hypothetical protein